MNHYDITHFVDYLRVEQRPSPSFFSGVIQVTMLGQEGGAREDILMGSDRGCAMVETSAILLSMYQHL